MPARTLIVINCQSFFPPHLTIIMAFSRRSAICRSNGIFRDRAMPAELVDLNRILLTLARSREFPDGSLRHGYDFIAPLDPEGHIDPILWKKYRDYCRVRRFWAGEDDEVGRLVHKPGGAEHARWVFEYDPVGMTTMKSATSSVNMRFCRATMSRSAERTASSKRFASSASILSCCRWPWLKSSNWKSMCDP